MISLHFIKADGTKITIEAKEGLSVMEVARKHNVDGIVAECGGSMACSTCHVFVDEDSLAKLDPMDGMEDDMLDFAATPRQENSRLSCQINLTAELDGLTVSLPEVQV